MGSFINPKPWVPYLNMKDCSQGICSLYCPQWCYTIFPPPPPIEFPTENPSPIFSPLIIAVIAILASGFLLVTYYAIISKYCVNNNSSRRREGHDPNETLEENEDPSTLEPWHVANNGLNEALIKSIAVCKYKRGQNLIEGTDCSVCLSEFEEDENLRLLPKCNHAFHVVCIDTWLRSHSNCPLCRANIVYICPPPPPLPPPVSQNEVILEDVDTVSEVLKDENKEVVIEIRDENFKRIGRSFSMDFDHGERLSVADVLLLNQNKDFVAGECSLRNDGVGSSKGKIIEMRKLSDSGRGLRCVNSPVSMKRSFSSERFSFSRRGKERVAMISL